MIELQEMDLRRIKYAALAGFIAIVLFLTAGCGIFARTSQVPLELDFSETLPEDWTPVDTWIEVDIDGDPDTEYLLLFTYEQGQVGAAIYDQQITPDLVGVVGVSATPVPTPTVELVPVPLQPLAYYRPYRLLPTSWTYAYGPNVGHGFIARPGDSENMNVIQVDGLAEDGDDAVESGTELTIRGGDTHLTFVWWLNEQYGYGISQLTAEAGFRFDWTQWELAPIPIEEISGLDPLTDYRARSLLCREVLYTRMQSVSHAYVVNPGLPTIAFSEQERGISFCRQPGYDHPFYPEGVVMAFIESVSAGVEENASRIAQLLTPGVSVRSIELGAELINLDEEMVSDIAAFVTVPALPPQVMTGEFLPTTTVCVEAAQLDEPSRRRWIVYTLRYQPPDYEERLPDRWTISGAEEMPALSGEQPAYDCEKVLVQLEE